MNEVIQGDYRREKRAGDPNLGTLTCKVSWKQLSMKKTEESSHTNSKL